MKQIQRPLLNQGHTGEDLVRRADDNPETLRTRLIAYHQMTYPVMNYYEQKGISRSIDASVVSHSVIAETSTM